MKESIILCGGLGTRIGGTEELPKPMIRVAGKPILEWIIKYHRGLGIKRIVLATGFGESAIKEYFGHGEKWGVEIVYSHCRQGTGTALLVAAKSLMGKGVILVQNGDTYLRWKLDGMRGMGSVVFHGRNNAAREGVRETADGKLKFVTHPEWPLNVFAGCAIINTEMFERFEWRQNWEKLLEGTPVLLVEVDRREFWDIGTIDGFAVANRTLAHKLLEWDFDEEWGLMIRFLAENKDGLSSAIVKMINVMRATLEGGGKVMVAGNGGSMADAAHFVAELQNGLEKGANGGGKRAMVLGNDWVTSSAVVNDYQEGRGYLFAKQVRIWGEPGDCLLLLSSTGQSDNLWEAVRMADEMGIKTMAIAPRGSVLAENVQTPLAIDGVGPQQVQELGYMALHKIAKGLGA